MLDSAKGTGETKTADSALSLSPARSSSQTDTWLKHKASTCYSEDLQQLAIYGSKLATGPSVPPQATPGPLLAGRTPLPCEDAYRITDFFFFLIK